MDDFNFVSEAGGSTKITSAYVGVYRGALWQFQILSKAQGSTEINLVKVEVYRGTLWTISLWRRKLEGPPKLIRPKWGYIGVHYGQF